MSRTSADTIATLSAMIPLLERGYISGELSALRRAPMGEGVQCFCLIGAVAEVEGSLTYNAGDYVTTVEWGALAPDVMAALAETIRANHHQLIGFDVPTTVWRYNDIVAPASTDNLVAANAARIELVRATIKRLQDSQENNHE